MEEVEKIVEELDIIKQFYGYFGVFVVLFIVIGGTALWIFLVKRVEKIAEEITDRNLKKFQSSLDKELVKFSAKHQKQIDAVQDCYQRFQELQSLVTFVVKGEKFTAQMQPDEEIEYLTTYRLEFRRSYRRNKILFPEELNHKIESLFPEIDTFIEDYMGGLMPCISDENTPEECRDEYLIAGIWPMGKLEPTLEKMDEINREIEHEFRRIYGTDEK